MPVNNTRKPAATQRTTPKKKPATNEHPLRKATPADMKVINASVKALEKSPLGQEALKVDARGLQMFQAGTNVYIHDTNKHAWFVSEGHPMPKPAAQTNTQQWAPRRQGNSDLVGSLAGAMGGLMRDNHRNAVGIALSGAAMSLGMGAASLLGGDDR